MILLISICKHDLHELEFVRPIEDILKKEKIPYKIVNCNHLLEENVFGFDKIIICGTSLKDNYFLNELDKFHWIKEFKNPLLGICGGMHLIGKIFNGTLKKQQEIGLTEISLKKEFFGLIGKNIVYELHNFYVDSKEFEIISYSENCPQIIKHREKDIFGVLFHPEVRNKNLITNFINR